MPSRAARMAGPVTAATLTPHRGVLAPPAVAGHRRPVHEIPADHTLIATLSASLVAALVFTPTLGSLIGQAARGGARRRAPRRLVHEDRAPGDPPPVDRAVHCLRDCWWRCRPSTARSAPAWSSSRTSSRTPGAVLVHARGKPLLAPRRTGWCARWKAWCSPRTASRRSTRRSGDMGQGSQDITEDVIGQIQFEFVDWKLRPSADAIMSDLRTKTAGIPGIKVEVTRGAGRAADRQGDPGPAFQHQPGCADRGGEGSDRAARQIPGHQGPRQRPADAEASTGRCRSTRRKPRNTASASARWAPWCSSSPTA